MADYQVPEGPLLSEPSSRKTEDISDKHESVLTRDATQTVSDPYSLVSLPIDEARRSTSDSGARAQKARAGKGSGRGSGMADIWCWSVWSWTGVVVGKFTHACHEAGSLAQCRKLSFRSQCLRGLWLPPCPRQSKRENGRPLFATLRCRVTGVGIRGGMDMARIQ